jgi:hypothetical protein
VKPLEEAIINILEEGKVSQTATAYAIYDTTKKGFFRKGTTDRVKNIIGASLWDKEEGPKATIEYEYKVKDASEIDFLTIATLDIKISYNASTK